MGSHLSCIDPLLASRKRSGRRRAKFKGVDWRMPRNEAVPVLDHHSQALAGGVVRLWEHFAKGSRGMSDMDLQHALAAAAGLMAAHAAQALAVEQTRRRKGSNEDVVALLDRCGAD